MSKQSGDITVINSKKKAIELNFGDAIKYRDLTFLFVKRNFVTRYKQMLLGPLWAVIQPLLTTIVFTVVFGNIAGLPTDGAPKFVFYMCGNVLWNYFSSCLTGNAGVFLENSYLFSKVYFPRLVSPVSTVLSCFVNSAIQFLIFLGFWIYYLCKGAIAPNYANLWLVPLLIVQVSILGMGIGLILASVTVKYRDLRMLISFGVQLWLYATPIAYASTLVKDRLPKFFNLFMLNPMASVVEAMRNVFLGTGSISVKYLLISAAVSILFLFLGVIIFNRAEKTFTDKI